MAKGDIKIVDVGGANVPPIKTFRTEAAGTDIFAGEPVKLGGTGTNYVVPLATGDPEIGTDIVFGIAASDSTQTATADGTIDVYLPLPGTVYRCAATTPANLALGILNDCVTFDLTAGVYTVDEDEGTDEAVHGLRIIDFDTTLGTVDFELKQAGTRYGNS